MNLSRESIFVSAIRSFCNAFFALLGVSICLLVVAFVISVALGSSSDAQKNQITLQPDAAGNRTILPLSSPVILRINIEGVIGANKLTTHTIENKLLDSRDGIFKSNRVKAILLYLDTPGGTVTDSNGIYELIKEYKEKYKIPVYAFVDGMCASGGMYISSAADKIYATPISVIGSVGVILGPAFNFYDLMEKWGVKAKAITMGKNKAMLNPFTDWKAGEDDSLYAVTDFLYNHFVDLVVDARKNLSKEKLIKDYGAQVYVGPVAEKLGFVEDGNASYNKALSDLALAAGIQPSDKYQVIELKAPRPIFVDLVEGKLPSFNLFQEVFPFKKEEFSLKDPFLYLYKPF